MSRKISDFFTKKSIKIESSEIEPKVVISSKDDEVSVKSEFGETDNPQHLTSNNKSEQENQIKIIKNIKTEIESQYLVILPKQKIHKHPVPIKIEDKDLGTAKHNLHKYADAKIQTFTCDLDGKIFKRKDKIVQHMKSHLPPVKCEFCNKKGSVRKVKRHILTFHTGIKPFKKQKIRKSVTKNENFQCQICNRFFLKKSNLNRHISEHNKSIKCKFCEKLFGTESRLKTHVKDYHENPKSFICETCKQKFTRPSHLSRHLKTHDPNRQRDLKCSECDYATDRKHLLKTHLNSHKRKNADIAAMKNPHKCPHCPSVLKSKKVLHAHMFTVHPIVLLECDICGKQMKNKYHILRHIKQVHIIKR